MRFASRFAIFVGLLMLIQWTFFLATGQTPEVQTAPLELSFHLAAEAATALALIISGLALMRELPWSRKAALVAYGMLAYTVMVSPGYFAQRGEWPMVVVFALLLALTVIGMRFLASEGKGLPKNSEK